MLVDNLKSGKHGVVEREGTAIIPVVRRLLARCRRAKIPVVYANDSFLPDDPLFLGRLKPHSLQGTPGAEVIAELKPEAGDLVMPKRRFSAFFKTDLDKTLRAWGIDTVAVCGVTTTFCVLTTALDALAHDFQAVILEDAAAAHKREVHEACLALYRKNAVWPRLRVQTSDAFLSDAEACT